ncbi:Calumenin [Liparis tanakae]|uniref:Calumenin n=1 Tax=Liparis tanakae TaxID=230148 RepID=A0A4Z2E2L9_9TELE|nr:Calumenin [Liparis tanakae]
MMKLLRSVAALCLLAAVAFAVPAQEKRIHHQLDLSDHAHADGHGFLYDHEAFLGKEEAKTFDQLTPEESKDKLAKIVERIDMDKDGFISHTELHYWIKHRQRRYIEENVNKHWKDYDQNHDGNVAWQEYKNTTYGFYLGNASSPASSFLLLPSSFTPRVSPLPPSWDRDAGLRVRRSS